MQKTDSESEISKFSKLANDWISEDKSFSQLHNMNESRLDFIKKSVLNHFNIKNNNNFYKGLKFIDIGCGGGIASIPLARLNADLTAIDASKEAIIEAKKYAKSENLKINFVCNTPEAYAKNGNQYDVVICLEVIEHVSDIELFCMSISKLLNKNGLVIISTINRNYISYLLAIIAAENILKMAPKNTHQYEKFVKPSELNRYFKEYGLEVKKINGISYNIFKNKWSLSQNTKVNYIASISKI